MKTSKITIKIVPGDSYGMLSDNIVSKCYFCQKKCTLSSLSFKNLHKISGYKEFFCGFCVRNGFNTRSNKDVLILTFQNVFSYYYSYKHLIEKKVWVSEIKDIVEHHKNVGLVNPAFHYDEENMNWFINFCRVGNTKRKLILEDVYKTTFNIIDSLKLRVHIPEIDQAQFRQKYIDAIELFSRKRYRPKNKKIISPKVSNIKSEIISFKNY